MDEVGGFSLIIDMWVLIYLDPMIRLCFMSNELNQKGRMTSQTLFLGSMDDVVPNILPWLQLNVAWILWVCVAIMFHWTKFITISDNGLKIGVLEQAT